MLEVLLTSLDIMQSEASNFALEIDWAKTKIQSKEAKNLHCPTGGDYPLLEMR